MAKLQGIARPTRTRSTAASAGAPTNYTWMWLSRLGVPRSRTARARSLRMCSIGLDHRRGSRSLRARRTG